MKHLEWLRMGATNSRDGICSASQACRSRLRRSIEGRAAGERERKRESGNTDVEGAGGPPRPTTILFQWSIKKKKLRCRERTLPDMLSHTQSHDIALSHNLNWIPRAYRVPCSPKALCMFSECLAYAAVT